MPPMRPLLANAPGRPRMPDPSIVLSRTNATAARDALDGCFEVVFITLPKITPTSSEAMSPSNPLDNPSARVVLRGRLEVVAIATHTTKQEVQAFGRICGLRYFYLLRVEGPQRGPCGLISRPSAPSARPQPRPWGINSADTLPLYPRWSFLAVIDSEAPPLLQHAVHGIDIKRASCSPSGARKSHKLLLARNMLYLRSAVSKNIYD